MSGDKPWLSSFTVELPVKLQSKSNFRTGKGSSKRWAGLQAFEMVVANKVREAIPDDWDMGDKNKPISERPIVIMIISATSNYDAANFSKSVADAVEGIVYWNDKSLRYPVAESRTDKHVNGVLSFALMAPGSPVSECRRAVGELLCDIDD